jgi:nucleotide-binding universal stress UspA family protein
MAVRQAGGRIMIKDIVVNLSVDRPADVAAAYAISVAEQFEAHLAAIAFAYEPIIPGTMYGGVPPEIIDAGLAESETTASAALKKFDADAERAGISVESHMFDATLVGGSEMFGSIARRYDIAIVAQAQPDKVTPEELVIEAALFASGRPVIVVPYIQKQALKLDRVLVCWDGSVTAARAIGDAMPFLIRAGKVEVIIVSDKEAGKGEVPGADMGEHLARHGVKVEVKQIVAVDEGIANTILSYAADFGADFLVMGGYGHSRLKEFILGGATRGILQAMTVPVLMSH